MHASQIYTDGPATSRATSSSLLPQNEQRSPDSGRNRRAMPASFVKEPIPPISTIRAVTTAAFPARSGRASGSKLAGGDLLVFLLLEEVLARDLLLGYGRELEQEIDHLLLEDRRA
jgi:hypothetical protein